MSFRTTLVLTIAGAFTLGLLAVFLLRPETSTQGSSARKVEPLYDARQTGADSRTRAATPARRPEPLPDPRAARSGEVDPAGEEADPAPPPASDDAVERFHRGDSDQRTRLIMRELGPMAAAGDEAALGTILEGLEDPSDQVRQAAVIAVGILRDPGLVPHLAPLVHDPQEDVREDMVKSLAKMRSPAATDVLQELVGDEDPDVVEDAIQALISADGRQAAPQIRTVALQAEEPWLAAKAATALRAFGDEDGADQALANISTGLESSRVSERRETVRLIAQVGGPTAIGYLQEALVDPDESVQREAARAIRRVHAEADED